jgi:hypothetical protein
MDYSDVAIKKIMPSMDSWIPKPSYLSVALEGY